MEVSIEIIEMLELCIIFFALGNFTFYYHIFQRINYLALIQIAIGLIYMVMPMQEVSELIFPIENEDEIVSYSNCFHEFKTDYDRENPVLKKAKL
jgi:uncharacterized membrane protein